jgi:hypothetical protein
MKARLWQKPNTSLKDGMIPQNSPLISTQEQYTPVYIQPAPTNHTNQPSFLGNIPQTAMNYRHAHLLQQQFPMNYNAPSAFSFARNPQQINMNFPPQTQFMNRNVSFIYSTIFLILSILSAFCFSTELLVYTNN